MDDPESIKLERKYRRSLSKGLNIGRLLSEAREREKEAEERKLRIYEPRFPRQPWRCVGLTKAGKLCNNQGIEGYESYCRLHLDQKPKE